MSRARWIIVALVVGNLGLVTCKVVQNRRLEKVQRRGARRRLPEAPPVTLALEKQCRLRAGQLREKLEGSFAYHVEPPFVIAGDIPPDSLQRQTLWSILRPAKAMWTSYFTRRPDKAITVLLFSGQKSYRRWAKTLFGHTDVSYFGYYTNHNRTLVMDIGTGGGTLIHELTHALIVYDFPNVPDWFNEGLASLHEGCRVGEQEIVGVLNWRLPILLKAIASGKLRSLKSLTTSDDFYGERVDHNYAQARYLMMYAQQKGVLKKLYRNLRDGHGKVADDVLLARSFGVPLSRLEQEFIDWAKTLRAP